MDNVVDFPVSGPTSLPNYRNSKNGGGDPPMTTLEQRVASLETQSAVINTKIDGISTNYATTAGLESVRVEIQSAKTSIIQWMIGVMLTSAGLAATIAFGLAKILN